ncbi:hypothetical protein [Catenulispora subtropica]|uniref:ATP-grasp domain-containing protein n=1 Tax=Catenulispora subtropica TaxID=450798 RepID=A0ABN2RI10_9ACTN
MSTLNWTVVAAATDPARDGWADAAIIADVAAPRFVTWDEVVAEKASFQSGETVLFERMSGWDMPNPVAGQRARYREFATALAQLGAAVDDGGATLAAAVAPTLLTVDRAERDVFLRANGVPVLEGSDLDEAGRNILRPRFAATDDWIVDGWQKTLFLHRARDGFHVRRSPAEAVHGVRELKRITELLAADGIYAVANLHRAHLHNDYHDIRFALIDGEVTHAAGVVCGRTVHRPWYGGRRRELDAFLTRFGAARWEKLVLLAERTATLFPGVRSLGVDLCLDNAAAEYVFDVDPFGADLPGALGMKNTVGDGVPVRAAVLRALSAAS